MNSTKEEIALLLNFAFNSNLTAQQIIDAVSGSSNNVGVQKVTLRELFSKENILKVCGADTKMSLIKRIRNSLFDNGSTHTWNRWNPEVLNLPVADAVSHKDFKQVKMWRNCGNKCQPIIYKMFQSIGVQVL